MSTSSQNPKRGEIYLADLPEDESIGSEQKGRRPVLVFSADKVNDAVDSGCVVIPLTRKIEKANRNFRIRILEAHKIPESGYEKMMSGDSVALNEQIRFLSADRMDAKRVAVITPLALGAVESGVKFVLGIP